MGRRGKQRYEDVGGVMPLREIARRLGVSERTASSDYASAVGKLKKTRAFGLLLPWVQASAALRREVLHAGSAECDAEFVWLWNYRTLKEKR